MAIISREYIDEHDIVARYLANQLSDQERESFEAYYLEHPEVLKELNRTAKFKSGLMDLRDSGVLSKILKHQPWWKRPNSVAIAASLVAVVLAGSIWFTWRANSRPLIAASVPELGDMFQGTLQVAGSYEIQRTRTSSYDATIKVPTNSSAIELRIKPEFPAASAQYRITLGSVGKDDAVTQLATTSDLQQAKDGFVTIYLNAAELPPAVYEVAISGDADSKAADLTSSFLIELVNDSAAH